LPFGASGESPGVIIELSFEKRKYHVVKCDFRGCDERKTTYDRSNQGAKDFFRTVGWRINGTTAYCPRHTS
jgi:hypothetical protein